MEILNAKDCPAEARIEEASPDFLPGQALVRFDLETPLSQLKKITEEVHISIEREIAPWGLYLVSFNQSIPVAKVLEHLRTYPAVVYAEPNYKLTAFFHTVDTKGSAIVTGQAAGKGFSIAVIDSGFDLTQPILSDRLLKNAGEIPVDQTDNDGNGYIDDFQGYDFYGRDPDPRGEGAFKSHGSEVISSILTGTEETELFFLPLRVGSGPWLSTAAICEAITYAVKQGVQMINLSFGGWWASQSLVETTAYAARQKVILVASAGKESWRWPSTLTAFPQIVWVAAAEDRGWKARFFQENPWKAQLLTLPNLSDASHPGDGETQLVNHNNVTSVDGKVGKTAKFVRTEAQYLSTPDNPKLSMGDVDFTVAAWVYLESKEEMIFASKGDSSKTHSNEYLLRYSPSQDVFEFTVGNGLNSWATGSYNSSAPATGTWYYIVAWYQTSGIDPNTLSIQVNNGSIDTATMPPETTSYDSPFEFTIGRFSNFHEGGGYMNGCIDEVSIWRRLLSPQERTDLYNNGLGNSYLRIRRAFSLDSQGTLTNGLVVYYPLESQKTLWRFGRFSAEPFRFIGVIGFGLFLYSSVHGITHLFRRT